LCEERRRDAAADDAGAPPGAQGEPGSDGEPPRESGSPAAEAAPEEDFDLDAFVGQVLAAGPVDWSETRGQDLL